MHSQRTSIERRSISPSNAAGNRGAPRYSPEIIEDDVQVGWGRWRAVQLPINDPSTNFNRGPVREIVRCLENDPGRFQQSVRLRLVVNNTEALACRCAE